MRKAVMNARHQPVRIGVPCEWQAGGLKALARQRKFEVLVKEFRTLPLTDKLNLMLAAVLEGMLFILLIPILVLAQVCVLLEKGKLVLQEQERRSFR